MPNHIWAGRAPKRTGGQYPTQHTRSLYGTRRRATMCVTPRQTCPRHNGFGRNLRSKTRWFTGFCNSHQVSHFAAFFIDARAKISVAESRFDFDTRPIPRVHAANGAPGAGGVFECSLTLFAPGFVRPCGARTGAHADGTGLRRGATRSVDRTTSPRGCLKRVRGSALQVSTMILPQVHLRKPCYDFSFL